jgi:hypothetical protein
MLNFKNILVYLKDPWTASWIATSILAILIPVIIWSSQRGSYYKSYGYALELEEKKRQYYENRDGNGNNRNNNNNNNYYSYYKECSWFNWPCRKRQYYFATMEDRNRGQQDGNYRQDLPGWYIFLGGAEHSEDMMRWKEQNTGIRASSSAGSSGGVKFVYVMTLLLFSALVVYGALTLGKKQPVLNLEAFLVVAATVALMNLVITAQGVISSDDRDMEDSYYGWYGQMGVLVAYTNFWIMLQCLGFLVAFRIRSYLERRAGEKEDLGDEYAEHNVTAYHNYNAPPENDKQEQSHVA